MLKKFVIAALVTLSSVSLVSAQEDTCAAFGFMAGNVMEARQNGMDMSEMVALANKIEDKDVGQAVKLTIIEAYKRPRFQSDEMIKREIEDFKNAIMVQCYEAIG